MKIKLLKDGIVLEKEGRTGKKGEIFVMDDARAEKAIKKGLAVAVGEKLAPVSEESADKSKDKKTRPFRELEDKEDNES